ncbi:hypothetical protein A8B78_09105 [Jannaschia sp. EhC01]|nr:hypothetical protein A8B78_09105 [Jannaschia sp. EhC01]
MQRLGSLAETTGQCIVKLSANLHQIDLDAGAQLQIVDQIAGEAYALTEATQVMTDGLHTVTHATTHALTTVEGSIDTLKQTAKRSKDVAKWVGNLEEVLTSVEGTLTQVNNANLKIAGIAKQVNILAVNARIEAARAGDAGRGFAVVAEAINALSKQTTLAANDVRDSTLTLKGAISDLRTDAHDISGSAQQVLNDAADVDDALTHINQDVRAAATGTEQLTETVVGVATAAGHFAPACAGLKQALTATAQGVHNANHRAEEIVDISENAIQLSVELGGDLADAAFIEIIQDGAAQIAALFEAGLDSGQISERDLFDRTYTPIAGTRPPQVLAPFTRYTDNVLPAVQDPVLDMSDRIIFCAAVDVNGYLPTHNKAFSAPQGEDEVWNAAHCRNRRIFDDRVGLKSGKNTAPFLMQTYLRDMGGGQHVLMKDVSAPIMVRGRHWGGLRMGLKPRS